MVERDVVALQQSHHQHQVHTAVELGGGGGRGGVGKEVSHFSHTSTT